MDAGVKDVVVSTNAAQAETVAVSIGTTLRLTVQGDALDSVEIEGLDLSASLAPESPAIFEVLADRAGSYPLRLVEADRLIATLEVSPQR